MIPEINLAGVDQEASAMSAWLEKLVKEYRAARELNPASASEWTIAMATAMKFAFADQEELLVVYLGAAIELMSRPEIELPPID